MHAATAAHLAAYGSSLELPQIRQRVAEVAARALTLLAGTLALTLLLLSVVELLISGGLALTTDRLLLALTMAVVAALGHWLGRRRPKLAAAALLLGLMAALGLHAWSTGMGLYNLAMAGCAVLLAVAGTLLGLRSALALGAVYGLLVFLLAWAEAQGWIVGRPRLLEIEPANRIVGMLLLGGGGVLAAALLHRLIGGVVQRALADQHRLAELLAIGADWVWEMERQGHLTYLSPSFEQRTGLKIADFVRAGQPGGPEIVVDAEWHELQQEMRRQKPFRDRSITLRGLDGTLLCVRGNGEPRFDAKGEFLGWRGVSRDVTRERAAQREQQRTQAMVDRMVQTSPDAICVTDAAGRIVNANASFAAWIGRSEADILGRTASELGLWQSSDAERLRSALGRDGLVRDFRLQTQLRGQVRDIDISAGTFEWDGQTAAVIAARDVTAVERAHRESNAILDNASVGIAFVRERQFERVNPDFEAMFGRAPGALAGQPVAELFPADSELQAMLEQPEQSAWTLLEVEREVPRPDGSRVLARISARAVDSARPREAGMIWVAEDITERRRFERELAEAKQQAESANQAKSAFLATMSHEIRTPLNGVLGLAKLLRDDNLGADKRAEYLSHLEGAAELLAGIVSDVLDLSKIEAGHLEIEHVPFDLHGVVTTTFHTFAPIGTERGLDMRCTIDRAVPRRVRGDPLRVRQILANYLNNALKFTQRGSVSVHVSMAAAGRVRLAVRDTGVGVAQELGERLFRPFVQADSSTTRRFGGTGLGLSICAQLAQRMGGEVGVDSTGQVGQGSTFWAELALEPDIGGATRSTASEQPQPLQGCTVLVAEDNPVNMLIVSAMLKRLGAHVLEAGDGAQAVELAQQHRDSLLAVLMDLHMPTLDGLQATRTLRAEPATATLPIFALSAAVLDNERQEANAAGMDGFIAKPVGEADLLRALQPLAATP